VRIARPDRFALLAEGSCPSAASSVSANRPIWLSVKDIDSSNAMASIFFMV
jgi:hypothetical protein